MMEEEEESFTTEFNPDNREMMEEEEESFTTEFNPDNIGSPLRKPRTTAPLRDTRRWMRPKAQQSTCYTHYSSNASSGHDVDAVVRSSNLSASAPEFVPSGLSASAPEFVPSRCYESTDISNVWGASRVSEFHPVAFNAPSANVHQFLKRAHSPCPAYTVGAEYAEACAEEPVYDPPPMGLVDCEQESLSDSGSTSDQGRLTDQAQDTVDFQPNLELPACRDKLKVRVTHVNSPGSFNFQLPRNNFQLKSVRAEDTEPCAEDVLWDPVWDPPLEVRKVSERKSLTSSGSASLHGSLRDHQALDTVDFLELPARLDKLKVEVTHANSPRSFHVQHAQNNIQLKSVGAEDTEPCTEDPPEWESDPPEWEDFIRGLHSSELSLLDKDSWCLSSSDSASDQGSPRDHQALDTHVVNSPRSFQVQHTQNNVQHKSVGAEDTEPCTEDPPEWESDPPEWEDFIRGLHSSELSLLDKDSWCLSSSDSASDQGSPRDHQALDTHVVNSPRSFQVQHTQNNVQHKSVGAEDTEPCTEDPPEWESDPPEWEDFIRGLHSSELSLLDKDSWCLSSSDSASDQGSPRDHQALDTVDFQTKVELHACDKLKVSVTHVNSPRSFQVQHTQNNVQLKSVGAKDTEPCTEPPEWEWDPPLEVFIAPEQESWSSSASDQGRLTDQALDTVDFQPNLELPACLDKLNVRVTHVNSPGSFYVQLTQNNFQLKKLQGLLKQEYGCMEPQDVQWEADMYCAVLINGLWERGQICNTVASTNTAEVRRCDFGNRVSVHMRSLRPLQDSLVGSLALECTLSDIRPAGGCSTWTATACDLIIYYLTGAMATMTLKELTEQSPVPVSLFCANQKGKYVCFADFLVQEGVALKERKQRSPAPSSPTLPVVIPKLLRCTSLTPEQVHLEQVDTTLYQPPELPCHGHITMSISAVGDDGVIYARTKPAEHHLEKLKHGIQQQLKTLPRQTPYTWKCVQGCSVLGPDMDWHRGQLLEVISGHVRVRYVDSGHVENIPVVHVYPMLLCEEVPQLCIPCQLYGLIPVGRTWQVDAVALLRNLLVGHVLDMQVMELPLESRGCVTVQIFLDGLNLSRIMCHHQHASVDTTVALQEQEHVNTSTESDDISLDKWDIDTKGLEVANEPVLAPFSYPSLPEEGEHFRVKVKHLYTPNEVFLMPVEEDNVLVNGETLEEAINRVNADIYSLPFLSNYPLGGACLAQYSDGRYYRARMMEFVGVNPPALLVQHVDFGSDDIMLTSKLRKMPAELLKFPASALKVRLCGFKPPRVNLETEMLPYSPEWSVKAAQVMIKLLHGKITASLVAKEPEPSVMLYDENGELVHLPLVNGHLADLVPGERRKSFL